MTRSLLTMLLLLGGCRNQQVGERLGEVLRVEPSELDFGTAFVGARPQRQLTVTNPSRAPTQASLTVAAPFTLTPQALSLGGGESASVTVTFSPSEEGVATSNLELTQAEGQVMVALRGLGLAALQCEASACQRVSFDPERSVCTSERLADGTPCTPSADCFARAECSAGQCVGLQSTCDDGDPCTVDACGESGCVHPPVVCPVTSACTVAFCAAGVGCQQQPVDDGVSCGPSDCASADICLNGRCERRLRPSAALDCSYDELVSSERDVCVMTRGGEVRCWGATGPRMVNGPRKVPTPPGFRFIPNHGGPMYGVDPSGMPWRFERPGVFRRVPADAGRYPSPVTMSAQGDFEQPLLVGNSLGSSEDLSLWLGDLRGIALGDPTLLLFADGGVGGWGNSDVPSFGEAVYRLDAAGRFAVCGQTAATTRCLTRGALGWSETGRADAGAIVGGFNDAACLAGPDGRATCGVPVVFPSGLSQLTRNHERVVCGLVATGDVFCHASSRPGIELAPGGLGDVSTLPLEPVEVPLPEPAVALSLSTLIDAQSVAEVPSYAATASGIWAWGGSLSLDGVSDGGVATPRRILPVQGITKLLVLRHAGLTSDTLVWLDRQGHLFEWSTNTQAPVGPPLVSGVRALFGCAPFAGLREEACGVSDGGWFWGRGLHDAAPIVGSWMTTFLLSDGGVITNARPNDLTSTTRIALPGPARFVSGDCAVLVG